MPLSKPIARIALRGDVPRELFWLLPLLKLDPFGAGGLDADLVVSFSTFDETEEPVSARAGWILGLRRGGLGPSIIDRTAYCANAYVAASLILSRAVRLGEPLLVASKETFAQLREAVVIAPATNVLIEGETGSGKGLLAQLIYRSSPLGGELLRVNCAVPEEVEAELRRTAQEQATGSQGRRTVLLDRISELSSAHQAWLAELLGEPAAVRYIATAKPQMDRDYGRRGISATLARHFPKIMKIAPLHQTPGDLIALAGYFLYLANPRLRLDLTAIATLRNYRFPGNIRELKNFITRLDVYERDQPTPMIRGEQAERLLTSSWAPPASTSIKIASKRQVRPAPRLRPHLRLVSNR